MAEDLEFLTAFDALPFGGYGGSAYGRRWRITKSKFADARSQKLEAEELGGDGYISLNLYRLASGHALLKPCEMSETKVRDFVLEVEPD